MAKNILLIFFFAMGLAVASVAGQVETLVVSCIDYRLRTEVENAMVEMYGQNSYDEIALPGAALGILNDQFKDWHSTFTQSLDVAIKLHSIRKVVFVDHEDCGAYKTILKSDTHKTHTAQMKKVRDFMRTKYPKLKIETYLMQLDGQLTGLDESKDPISKPH